ncbi:hypothetical protein KAR34_07200 [bacterium]|nr:hypothetical protein [bacterium]
MQPVPFHLKLISLLLLFMLSSCSTPKIETLEDFPLPDGEEWDMGYRAQDEKETEFKFVRFNETVRTWRDLITVIKRQAKKELPPLVEIQADLLNTMRASTPYEVAVKTLVKHQAEILYQVNIHNKHRVWEQSFTRILPGKKCLWIIQYSTRKTPIIDVREQAILKYLQNLQWPQ